MIVVNKTTSPISDEGILLGKQGENNARQIIFDLSWLIETYGDGTAMLVHQRSKDGAPYICDTEQSDGNLVWTVTDTDTAYDSWGKAELRWTVGETLAKTLIYKTMTIRSITADSEIPDPYQSWYDALIEYIDDNSISPEDLGDAIAEYIAEHPIESPVMSVNSKTGDVVLDAEDVGALPDDTVIPTVPTNVSAFVNDAGYLTSYTETDPTVPAWAKAASKPSYTASEVGALPSSTTIPTKTSDLQNDSGFGTYSKPSGGIPKTDLSSAVQTSLGKADTALQSFTETDPTVPSWAKAAQKPTYTAQEVGALPSSTVIPSVDNTLTVTGAAADAKKVGDELTDVKSDINQKYTLPSGGIPSSDLASAVQTSLGKADNAIPAPSSSLIGQFLSWNGSAWVASGLPVYSGGVS